MLWDNNKKIRFFGKKGRKIHLKEKSRTEEFLNKVYENAEMCCESISMITEKNNMHDIDTFMFFKWFFKAWVAVYLVTHTFNITMAVFDLAQYVVSGAAGVIGGNTNIDVDAALSSMQSGLDAMEIPELLLLVMETSLVSLCMKIMSVINTVILYVRMIEIYIYTSCKWMTVRVKTFIIIEEFPSFPKCCSAFFFDLISK